MNSPLHVAIHKALRSREIRGSPVTDLAESTPHTAPDLFSNDYLSITSDIHVHRLLRETLSNHHSNIFGATGSRLLGGNSPMHVQFEARMKEIFDAPAALLCNSGYDANVALLSCLPQKGDVIIFDELVHASTRDGIAASRAKDAQYAFAHNSVASLKSTVELVLSHHRNISEATGTVFIVVESLYSMDGDFAPLCEIVDLVDELIPRNCSHIIVDEAHSTGIYGPGGRGIVSMLGLCHRVHTVLHTFGKARAFSGAVLLTSTLVRKYMVNYARPFIFSTALPHIHILALNASFDYILGETGLKAMERLHYLCHFFEARLCRALEVAPTHLLSFTPSKPPAGYPVDTCAPIFPILTPMPLSLAKHLQSLGYACQPVPFPAVPKGKERIRVVIHAGNTESELEDIIANLLEWACSVQQCRAYQRSESHQSARL